MEKLSVYHGPIGKAEGERRLGQDGRDGSFLIRNSDTVQGMYCLCVLCKGFVYTYRLSQDDGGSWAADTIPGVPKRYFRQVKNMIAAFQRPGEGIAMPLLYAVTAQGRADTHTHTDTDMEPPPPPPPPQQRSAAQGHKNRNKKKKTQQAIG
ncbi:SH2 domain containing 1A duplicate a [Genypterus blacodes]|uniref:SH2 domain containing 1A duplicate a n=1 Tax=Genypterus blacodes TaxID=154954 RepID=UPI003F768C9F